MKELFESVWSVAPKLMSFIVIVGFMFFICLKVSQFYLKIEGMDVRLTRLEQKVDVIMEYIIHDADRHKNEQPTGK